MPLFDKFFEAVFLEAVFEEAPRTKFESRSGRFYWWLDGPWAQFFVRENKWPSVTTKEMFEGKEVALGSWAAQQRQLQKNGLMDSARVVAAEAAGFTWSTKGVKRTIETDEEFLFALELYREEHGHPFPGEDEIVDGIDLFRELLKIGDIYRSAPAQPAYSEAQVEEVQARVRRRWANLQTIFPEYGSPTDEYQALSTNGLKANHRFGYIANELNKTSEICYQREQTDDTFAQECNLARHSLRRLNGEVNALSVSPGAVAMLRSHPNWGEKSLAEWQAEERYRLELQNVESRKSVVKFLAAISSNGKKIWPDLTRPAPKAILSLRLLKAKSSRKMDSPQGTNPSSYKAIGDLSGVTPEATRRQSNRIKPYLDSPVLQALANRFNELVEAETFSDIKRTDKEILANAAETIDLVEVTDSLLETLDSDPIDKIFSDKPAEHLIKKLDSVGIPLNKVPRLMLETRETVWLNMDSTRSDSSKSSKIWQSSLHIALTHRLQLHHIRTADLDSMGTLLIKDFNFSVRTKRSLLQNNILTVGQLAETPNETLLAIPYFGDLSLKEVHEFLSGFDSKPPEALSSSSEFSETQPTPIDILGLRLRTYNCLRRAGISYVEHLSDWSETDLMKITNFGSGSLQDLKSRLEACGFPPINQYRSQNVETDKQLAPPKLSGKGRLQASVQKIQFPHRP